MGKIRIRDGKKLGSEWKNSDPDGKIRIKINSEKKFGINIPDPQSLFPPYPRMW
jgi:hypothetical protein